MKPRQWQRAAPAAMATAALLGGAVAWGGAAAAVAASFPQYLPHRLSVVSPTVFAQNPIQSDLAPDTPWTFGLVLPSGDPAGLASAAATVSDPTSDQYGQYRTAAQVASQYGPPAALVSQVESYLQARGFTTTLAGQLLMASGTVGDVDTLFSTHMVNAGPGPGTAGPRRGPHTPWSPPGYGPVVAPNSSLTVPGVLAQAVDVTGLVQNGVSPLSAQMTLNGSAAVAQVASSQLIKAGPGLFTSASSGPLRATAQLLSASVGTGLEAEWLITVTLSGQPDTNAYLAGMSGTASGAPGFIDSSSTNADGQFLAGTTFTVAQPGEELDAAVTDGTYSVTLPLASVAVTGAPTITCNLVGEATACPFNPAYNSFNTAYGAAGVVASARAPATLAVFTAGAVVDPSISDVDTFASTFGLASPTVSVAYAGADACQATEASCAAYLPGYEGELSLDLEMMETTAPGANIQIYESGSLTEALAEVDAQDSASAFSISYGEGEIAEIESDPNAQAAWDLLAEIANVEGITVTVAAGDSGGFGGAQQGLDAPMPEYPSNSPYVSALGATETSVSPAGSVQASGLWGGDLGSELTTPTLLSFLSLENMMGGGGVSRLEREPSYQASAAFESGRVTPDFSFQGSVVAPGALVVIGGALYLAGGTSVDAPLFAGWVGDLGQVLGHRLGNVNPLVYSVAQRDPSLLIPVGLGNNGVYGITPGLNPVNGLGQLNIGRLYADALTLGHGGRPAAGSGTYDQPGAGH